MYLSIIFLPLFGSIVAGFFGRKVGIRGAQLITTSCVVIATVLAVLAFIEVGINNVPVSIHLFRWIDSEWLYINWGFHFDSLTVAMLLGEGSVKQKRFVSKGQVKKEWTRPYRTEDHTSLCLTEKGRSFDFKPFYSKFSEFYPNIELPKKEFLEWFIGFAEGEATFVVAKRGDFSFSITQSSIDLQVLIYIKEKLGFGNVKLESSKKKTHRFRIQDTKNLYLLCHLFNGNMVFPTRSARFLIFLTSFNEKLLKKNLLPPIIPILEKVTPSLEDYWLSGIVDGEGCFSLSFLSRDNGFRLNFIITQKWKANKPILEHILNLFDCHGLVCCRSRQHLDYWDLKINGLKNCRVLFLYFDKYKLKSKKKESYLRWKEISSRLVRGDHLKANTRLELIDLAKQINKFN
jgi:LAGLIDADG endonuclease